MAEAPFVILTAMLLMTIAGGRTFFVEKMNIKDTNDSVRMTKPFSTRHTAVSMLDFKHDVSKVHASSVKMSLPAEPWEGLTGLDETFNIMADLQHPVSSTGPKFVGVTLDLSFMRREWKQFDITSKSLHSLATALAPSIFRVGGTAADFLIFNSTANNSDADAGDNTNRSDDEILDYSVKVKNFTINGTDWARLNELVNLAKWDLIFDFNEFLRQGDSWYPDNARELLKFSQEQGYRIPCFQLGNEPNAYYLVAHRNISAAQLVKDMQTLKSLLSEFPLYQNSCIVGPDVTKVTKYPAEIYLQEFLMSGGQNIVSAVTLHHYYFSDDDKRATIHDFVNASILDSLKDELFKGTSVAHTYAPSLPVWLSETSSVTGNALPGVTDGFVAGFMWLDKLGLCALYGLQAVVRQTFYHGIYPLVADDYTPNPDYYLTLLFKQLVQGPVFNVTGASENVRVYMQCANRESYPAGSLVVYALNIQKKAAVLNLTQFAEQSLDLFLLTPGDEQGLKSKYVALNGKKLEMVDEELPPLLPQTHSGPVTMAPYSFAYIVIPDADVKSCQ